MIRVGGGGGGGSFTHVQRREWDESDGTMEVEGYTAAAQTQLPAIEEQQDDAALRLLGTWSKKL